MSLDKSRILFSVPRGFSGGRLVALEVWFLTERLDVEALVSFASEGREPAKFDRLFDLPLESLSKTFDPDARRGSLTEEDRDRRSIREFFRMTGFFKSLSEWPGRMLPLTGASPSVPSTLIIGTEVTYLPSTSVES